MRKIRWLVIGLASVLFLTAGALAYSTSLSRRQEIVSPGMYTLEDMQAYMDQALKGSKRRSIAVYSERELLIENPCIEIGIDPGASAKMNIRSNMLSNILCAYSDPVAREIDERIYFMYDTDTGYRLYIFFTPKKDPILHSDGFPIVMGETLSYADFEHLQIGDSVKRVEEVDPATRLYYPYFEKTTQTIIDLYASDPRPEHSIFSTVHLLRDGILRIDYERVGEDAYQIIRTTYSKDFVLDGLYGKTCYKIYEEDYVSK